MPITADLWFSALSFSDMLQSLLGILELICNACVNHIEGIARVRPMND